MLSRRPRFAGCYLTSLTFPTAVQIVWSARGGHLELEHVGSGHDPAEVEALKAAARQRMVAGQGVLDLGLGQASPAGPLPIRSNRMGHL